MVIPAVKYYRLIITVQTAWLTKYKGGIICFFRHLPTATLAHEFVALVLESMWAWFLVEIYPVLDALTISLDWGQKWVLFIVKNANTNPCPKLASKLVP